MAPSKQRTISSFFSLDKSDSSSSQKELPSRKLSQYKRPRRSIDGSHFGVCPLCNVSFPLHRLPAHASDCNGGVSEDKNSKLVEERRQVTSQPIPGLFLYEDFITEEEEAQILAELDGESSAHKDEFLPWKASNFNGTHLGKRWGVHCNLRDRMVSAPENPLPHFVREILMPKLRKLTPMSNCTPNEANAIDYRAERGHQLAAHVDDRKLSKEPIANLSLAGDCVMTFRNVAPNRNTAVPVQRVLLRRRCLQVLTGKARYDFSHGIENNDLLSARRVSVTMRESPLTQNKVTGSVSAAQAQQSSWWKQPPLGPKSLKKPTLPPIVPTAEPIPGLFIFHNFITPEEEDAILKELDDDSFQPWQFERHTGTHREKRFGVDHDLWSREIRSPKHPLPTCVQTILLPKLIRVAAMRATVPNEVNAIDYRRRNGDFLKSHVDDRKKHSEPIANLSLCGDIYMTYRNTSPHRNVESTQEQKVLLPRRCLQVMTGKVRYEFSHGIENSDLLSDRRVSLTMRETHFGAR